MFHQKVEVNRFTRGQLVNERHGIAALEHQLVKQLIIREHGHHGQLLDPVQCSELFALLVDFVFCRISSEVVPAGCQALPVCSRIYRTTQAFVPADLAMPEGASVDPLESHR